MAGVQVGLDALLAAAAKLSRVELQEPPHVLGRNTTHALQSGAIHGSAALVDGIVERLEGARLRAPWSRRAAWPR